jgi:hypothetical protein
MDPKQHNEETTQPQQKEASMHHAQQYSQEFITNLIQAGLAGNVMEQTSRMFITHPGFEQWTKMSTEEREAAPDEVKAILAETEFRLEQLRFAIRAVLPMIADPKGFKKVLEMMRKRDIPIYDEENTDKKYSIILRGDFGVIPLGKTE